MAKAAGVHGGLGQESRIVALATHVVACAATREQLLALVRDAPRAPPNMGCTGSDVTLSAKAGAEARRRGCQSAAP